MNKLGEMLETSFEVIESCCSNMQECFDSIKAHVEKQVAEESYRNTPLPYWQETLTMRAFKEEVPNIEKASKQTEKQVSVAYKNNILNSFLYGLNDTQNNLDIANFSHASAEFENFKKAIDESLNEGIKLYHLYSAFNGDKIEMLSKSKADQISTVINLATDTMDEILQIKDGHSDYDHDKEPSFLNDHREVWLYAKVDMIEKIIDIMNDKNSPQKNNISFAYGCSTIIKNNFNDFVKEYRKLTKETQDFMETNTEHEATKELRVYAQSMNEQLKALENIELNAVKCVK